MLLKYFYDEKLAHASYMVGCQRTNEAVIVDPGRDIEQYLETADREGVRIVAVAETHIHADYVSGARELADRVGAKLYVSDEGPAEWKYLYLEGCDNRLVHDGDQFMIGNIRFDVLHTPGHTPESISFLLTDQGGGADRPMGIFTGDFVFVGSIGRPDLLEEAAGLKGTAEPGARDLFQSAERFKTLPDYLQVWPAHGAGSACGKGLGAVPSSTVGYEKRFNPALQFTDEEEFVRYILADQPEAPKYFAVMKRVNKEGPRILGDGHHHELLDVSGLEEAIQSGTVIDLTPSPQFAEGHVPGTINIPLSMLSAWAGWLVDYDRPTYLICEPEQLEEAARVLHKIGVEEIAGGFDAAAVRSSGKASERYETGTPAEWAPRIEAGEVKLIDVRSDEEWNEGHVEQAVHHFLGRLPTTLDRLRREEKLVVQCHSGTRSAIAAGLLQAAGYKNIVNLTGGYAAWKRDGLPSVKAEPAVKTPMNRSPMSPLMLLPVLLLFGALVAGPSFAQNNNLVSGEEAEKLTATVHPMIANHGAVVQLPNAVQQPRPGTKILVDLTRGSSPDKLNEGLEKVAKFLNIYAGAGAEPADVQIAVVFHGDATLAVLKRDAYAEHFATQGNPNLALLQELDKANVELYVCGQSLISKGSTPQEVAAFIDTAVSAITAVANLQADGYAYVPFGK